MGIILAAGDFIAPGGTISTTLNWEDDEVLDKDLAEIQGLCRLITPTAADGETLTQGVWFYSPDPTKKSPRNSTKREASLDLGTPLPSGYTYELWVYFSDFPTVPSLIPRRLFRCGRFMAATGPDTDGAGPDAGSGQAPLFPGQDFYQSNELVDLSTGGWRVMITIEAADDPAPDLPSSLAVLTLELPRFTGPNQPLTLSNGALNGSLPQVHVTVRR